MNVDDIPLAPQLQVYLSVLAGREGVSVEQFVASAVTEKVLALMAEDSLSVRAERGSRDAYDAALATVPDVEPDEHDRL